MKEHPISAHTSDGAAQPARSPKPRGRFELLPAGATDGILVLDAGTGLITEANRRVQAMLGKGPSELLGKALWEIGFFEDVRANREAIRRVLATGLVHSERLFLRSRTPPGNQVEFVWSAYTVNGGREIRCHVRQTTESAATERRYQTLTAQLLSLVSELQHRERRLFHLANHDALTGLYNRRFLDDILPRELDLARRRASSLCIAILDIDHFKRFNDCFGHEAGDLALRECARALSENLRKGDIACRIGGEEFALVLPDCTPADALPRLDQLREIIERLELWHEGTELGPMTVSGGIAGSPAHSDSARGLLRGADAALYCAKRAGRDRVLVYEGPTFSSSTDRGVRP